MNGNAFIADTGKSNLLEGDRDNIRYSEVPRQQLIR